MSGTAVGWWLVRVRQWLRVGRPPRAGLRGYWYVFRALNGRRWSGAFVPGPWSHRFAREFADLHGARHGLCVANGSVALTVAYQALGLRAGDEVVVPALTFSGTASSALILGIRPVFADVEPRTLCLDPESVLQVLTPRTRAIVVVHLGSQVADLTALARIARERGLRLIEDCAHAHGQRWGGRGVGTIGDIGCFSFQASKLITAGEGGMLLTDDDELAARCRAYVDCGRPQRPEDPPFRILGINLRLSEMQAALLAAQLTGLRRSLPRRRRNTARLSELLREVPGIRVLESHDEAGAIAGYFYAFRYVAAEGRGRSRDEFISESRRRGVPLAAFPSPVVYRAPEFGWRDPSSSVDYERTRCPIAEQAVEELVIIPHAWLAGDSATIRGLARAIRDAIG